MRIEGEAGVRSVQLALQVLEAVAFAGEPLGVTQIAERVGATKSSVHRHLLTFVENGYLVQDSATTLYSPGPMCRLLGHVAPETNIVDLARGAMQDLRESLGHSVVLSTTTPRGPVVVMTLASRSPIEIGVRPGSELPFHASAQGKLFLANSTRPVQERILARPMRLFTPKTITDRAHIEQELIQIVQNGYASAPEQMLLGVNAIAAPIFDQKDACVASLAVVGSIQHLQANPDQETIDAVKFYASQISKKLGHGRAPSALEAVNARTPERRRARN